MSPQFEIPQGYRADAHGALVPEESIKEIDKLRDEVVLQIVAEAKILSGNLAAFKAKAMGDIQAFIELSAEKYEVKFGGTKGNVSLVSFSGEYMVKRAMSDRIIFDERLHIAKQLIDECITEWAQGSRAELRTIINQAWQVDKEGKINTGRVLGLRRLDIKDIKWLKAMDAISDSITIAGATAYVRIYQRTKEGDYKQINLDVAAI